MALSPGPWKLVGEPRFRGVIKSGGPKPHTVCIVESWMTSEDTALIATSRELLEFVRAIAEYDEYHNDDEKPSAVLSRLERRAAELLKKAQTPLTPEDA